MKLLRNAVIISALAMAIPALSVAGERDCLLKGTVQHGADAGQGATQVKIHSVSGYDENSRCKVSRSQKMEFKLPQDSRVQQAPSGSEVEYRYRTDKSGQSSAELISVGA